MTRFVRLVGLAAAMTLLGLAPKNAVAAGTQLYVGKSGHDAGNNCRQISHPCLTIAHALTKAPPGATINISPGVFQERLDIAQNVLLSGQGLQKTFIDGTFGGTVVTVEPGWTVTLQSLTVENGVGTGTDGATFHASQIRPRCFDATGTDEPGGNAAGGIYNAGTLNVVYSGVSNNTATGGHGGTGGDATGTLVCSGNGDNAYGGNANGGNAAGGIFNIGALNVNGSTFSGNTATGGNGGAGGTGTGGDNVAGNGGNGYGGGANGGNAAGGIYNADPGTVRLTAVTFGGNNTGNGGPGGFGGTGNGGSSTSGNGGDGTGGQADGGFAAGGLFNAGTSAYAVFAIFSTLKGDTGNGGLGGTAGNANGGNGNNNGGGALSLFASGGDGAGEMMNVVGSQKWAGGSILNGTGHGGDGGSGGTASGGTATSTTGTGGNATANPGNGGAGAGGLENAASAKFVVTLIATFVRGNTGAGGSAGTAGTAIPGAGGISGTTGTASKPTATSGDSAGGILAYGPVVVNPVTQVRGNTPNNCYPPGAIRGCS
jgi:hypothetical protein